MRFESLTYFLEIAQCLSYTQASKVLYVSQQGLSKAIKSLEKELGCRLFKKDGPNLKLTAAGQALIPHAQRCLDDADAIRTAMQPFSSMAHLGRAPREERPILHATAFVSDSLFTLLEADLHNAGLDNTTIIERSFNEIVGDLKEGTTSSVYALALPAFAVDDFLAIPHLVFRTLCKTDIVLIGSSQFIHNSKSAFTQKRIAELPVIYYNDSILNNIISEMFREHPLQHVIMHASSTERIRAYVINGKAVTFSDTMSMHLADTTEDDIAFAPIEGTIRFYVGFAHLSSQDIPPQSLDYIDRFEQCFKHRWATVPSTSRAG